MNAAMTCPRPTELEALLEGGLGDPERRELEEHVGACDSCQLRLEGLATGDPSWSSCLLGLHTDTPPPESAFWPTYRKLEHEAAKDGAVATTDVRTQETIEFALKRPTSLSFLAPPERPGTIGQLDHFDVLEEIGRGGMGIVLRARDSCLDREVAIKVLDPDLAGNELAHKRFCREARAAASIAHEHVVGVHYVDEDDNSELPYLVMPLIRGETVEARLRRQGSFGVAEVVRIGMQSAAGLAAAHAQGLVHRDIKPGNIILERGTDRVKLTDFGLARVVEDARITRSGFVAGTPLYMSPEQARGEDLDARSDLFSLGAVLYELCTGVAPFEAKTPLAVLRRLADEPHRPITELNSACPDWLAATIDKLLAKEPARRYQSAAELAEHLANRLTGLVPHSPLQVAVLTTTSCDDQVAVIAPQAEPARASSPRWLRAGLALSTLIAVGAVAVIVLLLMRGQGSTGSPPPPDTGPPPRSVLNANTGPIWHVAFSPDGRSLAMALDDGTVKLWDLAGRRVRGTINAHRAPVWGVAFQPSGDLLATASDDGTVKLWKVPSGEEVRSLPHGISVRTIAFSPDGRFIVSGSRDGKARIWDVETGAEHARTAGHAGIVVGVAISSDGKLAATASGDKSIKFWDVDTGRELNTLTGHSGGVYSVALSRDGALAASGGWDKAVRLWDVSAGSPLAELKGHTQDIWTVVFAPDSRRVASVGEDRVVKLWDAHERKELATFSGHTGTLYTAAFSPDGTTLATGGRDGTVRIWDIPPAVR